MVLTSADDRYTSDYDSPPAFNGQGTLILASAAWSRELEHHRAIQITSACRLSAALLECRGQEILQRKDRLETSKPTMKDSATVAPLVTGRKIRFSIDAVRYLGEVVKPPANGRVEVRWFTGPGRAQQTSVAVDEVETARLASQQRVYVPSEHGWRFGRLICEMSQADSREMLRTYAIALPDGVRHTLPEDAFHMHCEATIPDPFDVLSSRAVETPFLFEHRQNFARALISQRSAALGLTGLILARVDLYTHQLEAVRRILHDPIQRYLLADEPGLGKCIEAGAVVSQQLLDEPDCAVTVLTPAHLVHQWQAEFYARFDLEPDEQGGLQILPHSALSQPLPTPELLVVDQAHLLTHDQREALADLAVKRLLLLVPPQTLTHAPTLLPLLRLLDSARFAHTSEANLQSHLDDLGIAAIYPRVIQSKRYQLEVPPRTRQLLRCEGDLDPQSRQVVWEAFEAWRLAALRAAGEPADPDQPDSPTWQAKQAEFAQLLHAVSGCSAEALAWIKQRRADTANPPTQAEAVALDALAAALCDDSADRVALVVGILRQELQRHSKLPRTVVCTSFPQTAARIAQQLQDRLKLTVARIDRTLSPSAIEKSLRQFRSDPACSLLVWDDAVVGLDMHWAERLIHVDLPLDPAQIEARLTRLDRLSRASAKVPSVVLCSQLDDPAYDDLWQTLLAEGFAVYTHSIGDRGPMPARLVPWLVREAFVGGKASWAAALPEVRRLLDESAPAANQGELERKALPFAQSLTNLRICELDARPLAEAFLNYLKLVNNIDLPRLQHADPRSQARYHSLNNVLMPENWYNQIAPDLIRPLTFDRAEAQEDLDRQFLRPGHPLLDDLERFVIRDDRGKAFAMWRRQPGYRGIDLFARLEYIVELDTQRLGLGRELTRLAQAILPRRYETVFVRCLLKQPCVELLIESDIQTIAFLARSYDKRRDDTNLGKDRAAVIDQHITPEGWANLCQTLREHAESLWLNSAAWAEMRDNARTLTRDYFAGPGAIIPQADRVAEALLAALDRPLVRVDAAGVIVLAGSKCP